MPVIVVSGSGKNADAKPENLITMARRQRRARLDAAGGLFISVHTDPTTGSDGGFAMLVT